MNKIIFSGIANMTRLKPFNAAVYIPTASSHYVSSDPIYPKTPVQPYFKQKGRQHRLNKWRQDRTNKVMKVDLPDFHKKEKEGLDRTPEDLRALYKERGVLPPRFWQERPIFISSTSGTFEPYVPPEGDGKISIASKEGAKQSAQNVLYKGKMLNEMRKLRQFEDDFDPKVFVREAEKIYIESHQAIVDDDEDRLHKVVTECAYPNVVNQVEGKQIKWTFLNNIEEPRAVHLKTTNVVAPDNIFAQITIRFHTQQTLAVYDRFGRLLHGSEIVARDVLEYIVFEKNISNTYGLWRVHDKIIPDWMPPRQSALKTYVIPEEDEIAE